MATPGKKFVVSGFAKKQLEKHGWTQGKGLGKSESGIADPIKVKFKHDTAGVGHDLGEQFSYHWWDHVFNKAANNIEVESDQDGVRVKQKGDNDKLISNKTQHTKSSNKPLLYGNFVKSATLVQDVEQPEDKVSASSDEDKSDNDASDAEDGVKTGVDRDEEFFKACGGRTAHKGARHGHGMSAKLRRIQAQESLHSEIAASNSSINSTNDSDDCDTKAEQFSNQSVPHKKKKKKRKDIESGQIESSDIHMDITNDTEAVIRTNSEEMREEKFNKKQKKREKRKHNRTLAQQESGQTVGDMTDDGIIQETDRPVKKKKKKSKSKNI